MDKVSETLTPTMPANTNTVDNDTANKQVIVRATEADHDRWKSAAAKEGISLSEFIRKNCNTAAKLLLDCQHPREMRRAYPWSEVCLNCGHRFR